MFVYLQTIAIRNGTEAFERWEELPVTILFKVYIFEVLNPVEITESGETPKVKEVRCEGNFP